MNKKAQEFNKRLAVFAGVTPAGESRLRAIWGPDGRFWDGKPRYIARWEKSPVYYRAQNVMTGEVRFYRSADVINDLDANWMVLINGGIPVPVPDERWYIEWWISPERVAASPVEESATKGEDDWNNFIGSFPREGLWMTVSRITDKNGGYRDLDNGVFLACLDFLETLKEYDAFGVTGINARKIADETIQFIRAQRMQQEAEYQRLLQESLSEGKALVTPKVYVPRGVS